MLFPEVKLYTLLENLLSLLREDYLTCIGESREEESFIFRLLNGVKVKNYDFYDNAKAFLIKNQVESPRYFEIRQGFDRTRANIPTAHIMMGADNKSEADSLGFGLGDEGVIYLEDDNVQFQSTRNYNCRLNIVCSSDIYNETLIVYYVLRALIQTFILSFENIGLQNLKISGQDIVPHDEIFASGVYLKNIYLDCFYQETIPTFKIFKSPTGIRFEGSVKE